MKTLNRILTVLIFTIALALTWAWIGRTGWASDRTVLEISEGFDSSLEPVIKIAGTLLVAIAAIRLIERAWSRLRPKPRRVPGPVASRRGRESLRPPTSNVA